MACCQQLDSTCTFEGIAGEVQAKCSFDNHMNGPVVGFRYTVRAFSMIWIRSNMKIGHSE